MLQCKLSRVSHLFASCVFFEYDPVRSDLLFAKVYGRNGSEA
jgi:hypothetical protein